MTKRHVVLLGDVNAREFQAPLQWLQSNTDLYVADSCREALKWLHGGGAELCHAIVLAQARRGALQECDVEQLHAAAPLARLIALLGTWCEGDQRSHTLPSGVSRVYWHQFCARAEREWKYAARDSTWALPRTANENDHLLHPPNSNARHAGLIAVRADSVVAYECLADMCRLDGWSAVWLPPRQPIQIQLPTCLLWDASAGAAAEFDEWHKYQEQLRPITSIVLLGFPRHEDVQRFTAAGASGVVAKPFLVSDLLNTLGAFDRIGDRRRAG